MINQLNLPYKYALPGKPGDVHIIPLSGGIDSTALAIVMRQLFPEAEFRYVFTDTKAEPPELYDVLDRLERLFDIHIERLIPDKGLIELCKSWGGFLPGYNSRYCTANLKAKPFNDWLGQFENPGVTVHSYVGIRADEDRVGLISREDWVHQHMPFKDMGVIREDVFRIVDESGVSIPKFYLGRSRSGCTCCPYSRKSESIFNMRQNPEQFYEGEEIEIDKLNTHDQTRWNTHALQVAIEANIGRNHLGYPIPERLDIRTETLTKPVTWAPKRKYDSNTLSLFEDQPMTEVWVLVEFLVHPGCGDHGIWRQELVTYSRTRGGLTTQAQNFWYHRLHTAPVLGLTREQMKEELKFGVYRLNFPQGMVDTESPGEGSYTWKSGISYRQLRHVVSYLDRTLHVEGMRREIKRYASAREGSWAYEHRLGLEETLANIREPVGELMGMDMYVPPNDEKPIEDEREVACFACSL